MIRGLVTPNIAGCEPFEIDLEYWFHQATTGDLVAFAAMAWNTERPLGISTPSAVSTAVEILRFYTDAGDHRCDAVLQAHRRAAKARQERGDAVDMDALPTVRAHDGDVGLWVRDERPELVEAAQQWKGEPEFAGGAATILLCSGGPYDNPLPWSRPEQSAARLEDRPHHRVLGPKGNGPPRWVRKRFGDGYDLVRRAAGKGAVYWLGSVDPEIRGECRFSSQIGPGVAGTQADAQRRVEAVYGLAERDTVPVRRRKARPG